MFKAEIQRKLNDSTSTTSDLILDFLNDRIEEIQSTFVWSELNYIKAITLKSGVARYTLSGDTATRLSNLKKMYRSTSGRLDYLSLHRYLDYVEQIGVSSGDPTVYVPINETDFYVYPTPNVDLPVTGYFQKRLVPFTSGGTIPFDNEVILALKYGVLADCLRDRSDDEANTYEIKYQRQLKVAKSSRRMHDTSRTTLRTE